MKKAIGQTVRDLKREVNKKVLKVPGIEQKVLDATSNEAWGPHGSLLADIAQASRNFHEYQMIMAVIWRRINDTGKNWRHVYKALIVLEYLVGHGSERVIEDIREHAHQISMLSNFQYMDSSGRDQGNNVRKKSQSLVILVNDKERIIEVRQKAAANRDRFCHNSTGGMYKPGSDSSSGAYGDRYDDDRYRSREEDRSGYGYARERELGYRDDDLYSGEGDRYGRDYEERYSRDGYRDDEYSGRNQSADDYQYGSRSRNSDRDHDRGYDDDGQHSSRGGSGKAEDHSLEGRLEQKLSQQNMGAPPSYEEAAGESRSPVHNERDDETSAASAPKVSSPISDNLRQTSAPTGSFPLMNDNPTEATAAATTATSGKLEVEGSDEFDPRLPVSAALAGANIAEIDLFGSLPESFSSNALALVPSASTTSNLEGNVNLDSTASFAAVPSTSNNFNQSFEDPFGDSPFKAISSTESAPSQPTHQSLEPSQSSGPNLEAVSIVGSGGLFSVVPYSTWGASNTQPLSTNSQFLSQDFSTPPLETDILADILPPAPLPGMTSQQNYSASPDSQSSLSFSVSSGKTASQPFFVQSGQLMQQGFSAATNQPAPQAFSGPCGQPVQPPFLSPISQHAQQPFSAHVGQPTQSSGHMYGGFHSQAESLTPVASSLFPQSQSGYNGPMNSGNFLPQGSTSTMPSHMAPQAPTGQLSQSTNYFPQHGGSTVHNTFHLASKSPADQASQSNSGNFIAPQGSATPSTHQPLPLHNASNNAVSSTGSNSLFSQPSKEKFETKSTVWADTLSKGLVNLNISGSKINPLADIGIDFNAINRKEKRMEKPTTTAVISTVTMGKAMGSGSGIGRAGAGAGDLRPSPNPMMGMGMGRGPGVGMQSYGGMNAQMGMSVRQGVQMQPPRPSGLPPGSSINIPGSYNNPKMGTGIGGYPQHQQPYGGSGSYQ